MQPDYDSINMDNEWVVGIKLDEGDLIQGLHYYASANGVLWASGWVRCLDADSVRAYALELGQRVQRATVRP